jgi:hypothetical protein
LERSHAVFMQVLQCLQDSFKYQFQKTSEEMCSENQDRTNQMMQK